MSAGIYMSAQKNIANGLHFELVVRGLTLQKRNLSCNAKKIHLRCELALFSVAPFATIVKCQVRSKAGWQHHFLSAALDVHWRTAACRVSRAGLWPGQRGRPWPHGAALAAVPRWGAPASGYSMKMIWQCHWPPLKGEQEGGGSYSHSGHSTQLSSTHTREEQVHLSPPLQLGTKQRCAAPGSVSAQLPQKECHLCSTSLPRTTIMQGLEFILCERS